VTVRRFSLASRILCSAIAIVQVAMPALAVIADAQLVANSAGAPLVHIEEHSNPQCRAVHPDDCALCQFLTHSSAPRAAAPAIPSASAIRTTVCDATELLPTSIARAHQRSRAPPVGLS
jgi:hypothetical protein